MLAHRGPRGWRCCASGRGPDHDGCIRAHCPPVHASARRRTERKAGGAWRGLFVVDTRPTGDVHGHGVELCLRIESMSCTFTWRSSRAVCLAVAAPEGPAWRGCSADADCTPSAVLQNGGWSPDHLIRLQRPKEFPDHQPAHCLHTCRAHTATCGT